VAPSFRDRAAQRLQRAWLSRGPLAVALLPVAALFGCIAAARRQWYGAGFATPQRLPVPVIVVGNLVAGGAGKTPTVIALVHWLRERGQVPGIVSRGHGRAVHDLVEVTPETPPRQCGDEPLLLRLRTGAPVVVAGDRLQAARTLLQRHPQVDVIVCDDGLQHLALARDAQVIVFDERGAGNGWLLPSGPLREPLPTAVPPRSVVLYNNEAPSTPLPGALAQRRLAGLTPLAGWWQGEAATLAALTALRGREVVAAAGVARPQRFFAMLAEAGLAVCPLALPDHHDFSSLPWPADTGDVVVTEKDAVKLAPHRMGGTRVWVATLDFQPEPALWAALATLVPPAAPR
jgi:tetraacyldisaccharide 4'-kinase